MSQGRTYAREYILERSQPIPHVGCWLWLKSIGTHGYGQAFFRGKVTTAQRVSYVGFNGEIPEGHLVQHSCDNKWCVNPWHLSIGNDATNAEDKRQKGRARKKLSLEDRKQILRKHEMGVRNCDLAREYSVDPSSIHLIVKNGF